MPNRFLRPLLIVEFLLAVQVWLSLWSQVGGQYHLDLMFWPWKLGLTLLGATLICAITADLLGADGSLSRRGVAYIALLIVTLIVAGVVTYYYHVNEPTDDQQDDSQPAIAQLTRAIPWKTY